MTGKEMGWEELPDERKRAYLAQVTGARPWLATARPWEGAPLNVGPLSEPRCAQPVVARVAAGAIAVLVAALVAWWWA